MIVCATAILAKIHILQGDFQMSQIAPIASATPNGKVRLNRRFRWIPDHMVKLIEAIEEDHFLTLVEDVSERGIYKWEAAPQTSPRTIGIRKDATIRDGSDSFRRKRGPGYKRQRRDDDRIARLELKNYLIWMEFANQL